MSNVVIVSPRPLWEVYARLNMGMWGQPHAQARTSLRKIRFDGYAVTRGWDLFGFWAYSGYTTRKLKTLIRDYLPDHSIDLAKARINRRLKERVFQSIGVPIGTGKKDKPEKTGQCITGMEIKWIPKGRGHEFSVHASVSFRVSEITRRLLGDFLFVDHVLTHILDEFGWRDKLETVSLYFGSYYVTMDNLPVWMGMWPGQRQSKGDVYTVKEWEKYLQQGQTGKSTVSGKKLKHGAKVRAHEIYVKAQELGPLFLYRDGKLTLKNNRKEWDGPKI